MSNILSSHSYPIYSVLVSTEMHKDLIHFVKKRYRCLPMNETQIALHLAILM